MLLIKAILLTVLTLGVVSCQKDPINIKPVDQLKTTYPYESYEIIKIDDNNVYYRLNETKAGIIGTTTQLLIKNYQTNQEEIIKCNEGQLITDIIKTDQGYYLSGLKLLENYYVTLTQINNDQQTTIKSDYAATFTPFFYQEDGSVHVIFETFNDQLTSNNVRTVDAIIDDQTLTISKQINGTYNPTLNLFKNTLNANNISYYNNKLFYSINTDSGVTYTIKDKETYSIKSTQANAQTIIFDHYLLENSMNEDMTYTTKITDYLNTHVISESKSLNYIQTIPYLKGFIALDDKMTLTYNYLKEKNLVSETITNTIIKPDHRYRLYHDQTKKAYLYDLDSFELFEIK